MTAFLLAVAATSAAMVAVFFLRFWRDSRDRFFLLFAIAFAVLSTHWTLLATLNEDEHAPAHYTLRVVGFLLILGAIIDKNRR